MIKITVAQKNLVEPTGTWTYHAWVIESDTTKMRLIWAQGSFAPTSNPDRNKYAIRYPYAYKAIRTNLIWNLFGQRHSLPRSHTTSLSIYLGQLRPIFEWWIDMALHRYRRFLQRMVTFGKGAVSGWSGWGWGSGSQRTKHWAARGMDKTAAAHGTWWTRFVSFIRWCQMELLPDAYFIICLLSSNGKDSGYFIK